MNHEVRIREGPRNDVLRAGKAMFPTGQRLIRLDIGSGSRSAFRTQRAGLFA
jgi:hypothetical protein